MSENMPGPKNSAVPIERIVAEITATMNKPGPAKPAPRPRRLPTPNQHLVAYVDILGFGNEVAAAKTPEALKQVYDKIRFVQQELENPIAVEDTEEQAALNAAYGKRVLALSDGVVVALTDECSGARLMDPYSFFLLEIWRMMLTQARCVPKGIFLRGGISHGTFFFEDDILLSPPLVTAYRLESKLAVYPVILIDSHTRNFLANAAGKPRHPDQDDPFSHYFRPFESPNDPTQELYMLDYLPIVRDEDHGWIDRQDMQAYIRAPEEQKSHLLRERDLKNAAWFLGLHKNSVLKAYHAASDPRVKEKYSWLMQYHNDSVPNYNGMFDSTRINIEQEVARKA